jgi:UDP-N-acetylglucosamine transferase subunit ALG13
VVPRRSDFSEHVDDHQIAFSRRLAASDAVWLAETRERLDDLLDRARVEPELFRAGETTSAAPSAVDAIESLVERLLDEDRGVRR